MTLKTDYYDAANATEKKSKLKLNEWTFTLVLFLLSFAIVLAKLALYYGMNSHAINHMVLHDKDLWFSPSKLVKNTINYTMSYEKLVDNKPVNLLKDYYWLLRALLSGASITSFTWYIIYKDSHIPGVNPPSPLNFKHSKHTHPRSHYDDDVFIHLNYLLGLIFGVIVFLYMCF